MREGFISADVENWRSVLFSSPSLPAPPLLRSILASVLDGTASLLIHRLSDTHRIMSSALRILVLAAVACTLLGSASAVPRPAPGPGPAPGPRPAPGSSGAPGVGPAPAGKPADAVDAQQGSEDLKTAASYGYGWGGYPYGGGLWGGWGSGWGYPYGGRYAYGYGYGPYGGYYPYDYYGGWGYPFYG